MVVGGVLITVACLRAAQGWHAVHCLEAGDLVATAGLGTIDVGIGVLLHEDGAEGMSRSAK